MNDSHYKTAYKKAFSVASQAVNKAISDSQFVFQSDKYDEEANIHNFNVFKSYFNIVKDCSNKNNSQCWDHTGEFVTFAHNHPTQSEQAFIDSSGMAGVIMIEKKI